jgi:hypothetical protein
MQDINNIVYIPLNTMQYRYWDQSYGMKDGPLLPTSGSLGGYLR